MIYMWLALLFICIVIEFVTMGLTTVWFAGGALVSVIAAALGAKTWLQVVLFVVVSLALLFFTRPIAVKYFNKERFKSNVEGLIGKQAIVVGEISNLEGVGQVTVGGQEWSARSTDEDVRIPIGTVVIVKEVNGVKLIVEPK